MDATSDPNVAISETSNPNVTASETSDQKVASSELSDQKLPVSVTSDQKVASSELSDPKLPVSETSDQKVASSELSAQKLPVSEASDQKVASSELCDQKLPISLSSDQKVIVSEHPDPNITVLKRSGPKITASNLAAEKASVSDTSPSRKLPPSPSDDAGTPKRAKVGTDDLEFSQDKKSYDFAFILRPAKTLTTAIEAFSDPILNPEQEVLLMVGPDGFELSVWHLDRTANHNFVMLQLKSTGLEEFQCTKPMRKKLALPALSRVLRAADVFNPESVAIFVEEGSSRISFQWGTSSLDFALGRPINIDIKEAQWTYRRFPTVLYMHETILPSKDFITVLTSNSRHVGYGCHLVELNIIPETEREEEIPTEEAYKVRVQLSFRLSVQRASVLAENCSVYLIRDPQHYIMVSFKLGEVGEIVYLTEADFVSLPHGLPNKGQYGSLLI